MKIHKQGATQLLFRVAGRNMKPCYKKFGVDGKDDEETRFIEVTHDLYKKGITCIADSDTPVEKGGMVEATQLNVGDFILIKGNGIYRKTLEEMKQEYVF